MGRFPYLKNCTVNSYNGYITSINISVLHLLSPLCILKQLCENLHTLEHTATHLFDGLNMAKSHILLNGQFWPAPANRCTDSLVLGIYRQSMSMLSICTSVQLLIHLRSCKIIPCSSENNESKILCFEFARGYIGFQYSGARADQRGNVFGWLVMNLLCTREGSETTINQWIVIGQTCSFNVYRCLQGATSDWCCIGHYCPLRSF